MDDFGAEGEDVILCVKECEIVILSLSRWVKLIEGEDVTLCVGDEEFGTESEEDYAIAIYLLQRIGKVFVFEGGSDWGLQRDNFDQKDRDNFDQIDKDNFNKKDEEFGTESGTATQKLCVFLILDVFGRDEEFGTESEEDYAIAIIVQKEFEAKTGKCIDKE